MEWNIDLQIASPTFVPLHCIKTGINKPVPIASIIIEVKMIFLTNKTTCPNDVEPTALERKSLFLKEIFLLNNVIIKAMTVIKPRPPI